MVVGCGVASYPLLSQAPTPVEVELGCDKISPMVHAFLMMTAGMYTVRKLTMLKTLLINLSVIFVNLKEDPIL